MAPKTKSERLHTINEIKMNCIENNLGYQEIALKVLYAMMDNYYKNGITYINKSLRLQNSERNIIVNLYNDTNKTDCVVMRNIK